MARRYKRNRKKGLSLLILALLSALSIILVIGTGYFTVKDIKVEGNLYVSEEEILDISGVYKGANIFSIKTGKAARDLKVHPFIMDAKVTRDLPSTIVIHVNERELVGYIPFMGSYLLVDSHGKVVSATPDIAVQSIPTFEGVKVKDFTIGEILQVENPEVFGKMNYISGYLTKYLSKYIPVVANIEDLEDIKINLNNRFVLKIGSMDNLAYKLKYGNTILEKLYGKEVSGELDLTSREKAFFRPW